MKRQNHSTVEAPLCGANNEPVIEGVTSSVGTIAIQGIGFSVVVFTALRKRTANRIECTTLSTLFLGQPFF